jgi:DNA-binding transcriptional MerR regulator
MRKTAPAQEKIPDKLYFKIGEVSKIVELPPYVLRFWENEFGCINPKRTSSGQRMYRKKDVETILKIKHLLHDKKYTIKGAKQMMTPKDTLRENPSSGLTLKELCRELESIRNLLDG